MTDLTWLAVMLLFPAFLIWIGHRVNLIDKLGLVLLCFAFGISLNTLANALGLSSFSESEGLLGLQTQITEIAIALAIPLLVMSIDLKAAVKHAGMTSKAMLAAFLSILLSTMTLSFVFNGHIDSLAQVAGLAVGAYTGGGPNMAAINAAIEGDQTVFVKMTSYDIMLSAIYLLFALSVAKPLFSLFLNRFDEDAKTSEEHELLFAHLGQEESSSYAELAQFKNLSSLLVTIVVAALVLGLSLGLSSLLPESMRSAGTIILITSLGMAASFIPAVRSLKISFRLGMYLVLVFCFTMGSMTNLAILADLDLALFAYIGFMLMMALVIHAAICKLLKVDVDTFIVTASAAIMSVPFIPVIVGALRNRALLVPGFCAAIIGYVLGNYFGIAVALSLEALL